MSEEQIIYTCPDCGSHDVVVCYGEYTDYYICNDCGYESYESEDCWE